MPHVHTSHRSGCVVNSVGVPGSPRSRRQKRSPTLVSETRGCNSRHRPTGRRPERRTRVELMSGDTTFFRENGSSGLASLETLSRRHSYPLCRGRSEPANSPDLTTEVFPLPSVATEAPRRPHSPPARKCPTKAREEFGKTMSPKWPIGSYLFGDRLQGRSCVGGMLKRAE